MIAHQKVHASYGAFEVIADALFDVATHFTCDEAEAVADLLDMYGHDGDLFLDAHADGDEPDDRHYKENQ